jgi:hypothetical protein
MALLSEWLSRGVLQPAGWEHALWGLAARYVHGFEMHKVISQSVESSKSSDLLRLV